MSSFHRSHLLAAAAGAVLALSHSEAEAADSISNLSVVAETGGQLILSVTYNYDSQSGDNVWIGAEGLSSSGTTVINDYLPWQVRAGTGRAYIDLANAGSNGITSSQIRVFMYRANEDIIASQTFSRSKTWSVPVDDIEPYSFRTTSQTPKDLNFQATYTLRSSHSKAVRMGAYSLLNGSKSTVHGYGPSAPLNSGSRLTTSARLSYIGSSTTSSDALLLSLYEEGSAPFAYTAVPRVKYWASDTTDSDGDTIGDANEAALGTSTSSRDTDHDGLEDGWELEGYRWSGYQYFDANLPFMGASARHRDVFVDEDYEVADDHDHALPLDSLYKAKSLYGAMSISNSDGRNGITLHILKGDQVDFDGSLGGVCGQKSYLSYFPDRLARIYHWTIAAHGRAGQGEIASNHFVFGTGDGTPFSTGSASSYDRFIGYAILVHELGHNLGLVHQGRNGSDQSNCKANYPSLMNYAYDYAYDCSALTLSGTQIRFSSGNAPTLDEDALSETSNSGLSFVNGFDSDFLGCNEFDVSGSSIDWNRNGSYSGTARVDFSSAAPSCDLDDGYKPDQRDSNDFSTVVTYLDDSIASPAGSSCAGATRENGYMHAADQPSLEPVCGLPAFDGLEDHPWLNVNPVFRLRPGMRVVHPTMRRLLDGAIDGRGYVRADVPLDSGAEPQPGVFQAPHDALGSLPYPAN